MRKTRIFALLCALVLVLGSLSFASAESKAALHMKGTDTSKVIGYEGNFYVLKNGKSASFYVSADYVGTLYGTKDSMNWSYRDIVFDCDVPVKAKCSASWVHITNTNKEFFLTYDANPTQKNRTATVTVSGKGYKAKFKLIQIGSTKFVKITRSKNVVTAKFKIAKMASKSWIEVNMNKWNPDDETLTVKDYQIDIKAGKTSVKFKVKAGWSYNLNLVNELHYTKNRTTTNYEAYAYFYVSETTGSETVFPRQDQ